MCGQRRLLVATCAEREVLFRRCSPQHRAGRAWAPRGWRPRRVLRVVVNGTAGWLRSCRVWVGRGYAARARKVHTAGGSRIPLGERSRHIAALIWWARSSPCGTVIAGAAGLTCRGVRARGWACFSAPGMTIYSWRRPSQSACHSCSCGADGRFLLAIRPSMHRRRPLRIASLPTAEDPQPLPTRVKRRWVEVWPGWNGVSLTGWAEGYGASTARGGIPASVCSRS